MEIKELLMEDATKKVYATGQSEQILVAFNELAAGKKSKEAAEKAELNNAVSAFLFEYLESYNVPTYFVRKIDEKSFLAKKSGVIPIRVTVYNIAFGDLATRLGLEEGKLLEFPVVEMFYRNEKAEEPMINEYHAYALGLCDRKEMTSISRIATKVNAVLKSFFDRRGLKLVNFDLRFSRLSHQILLADEVSIDSMNLWLVGENGSFVKPVGDAKKDLKLWKEMQVRILGSAL